MSKRVFMTGGTGFIGSALVEALRGRGDEVRVLTRDAAAARKRLPAGVAIIEADPATSGGAWQAQLAGTDAVLNLAGAPIDGKRWDAHYKQILRDSRVETTRHLVEGIAALPADERPKVLVSASGGDYYPGFSGEGMVDDDEIDESAPPGESFLARLCARWEDEANAASAHDVRVVRMRTSVVLGPGGAFEKLVMPFKLFVGGPVGDGEQWFSWIHLEDAVRAYLFAMDEDRVEGPINLCAPGSVRFKTFAKALGRAMKRPSWLPVPGFALKAALGEFAEYLLHGRRMVPSALEQYGFAFRYPEVGSALDDLVGN
ncbi:TIGR01777 family oxidoreductase [Haliangium ochraceum]|uniref:NAD-dependent epimerase/dehydratase n=1 Tax=Haliangium ochraceum (strain DSM 14365 / JCM 11303 / SMP-2) TaxID=502025 RepID=D0LU28_HALO1|nr:TIGR01777 family oxidoreductase [Haliangium ochraceum]ACY17392.1 domain of unknown function DUF1731 [Haliangium ochraceum DSM 14365]